MRRLLYPVLALVVACAPARADDKELKDIVAKAIEAHGGAENLAKLKVHSAEDKGVFHGMGFPIPYTATAYTQDPDKMRVEIRASVDDNKFEMVRVVDGKKGWVKVNDMVQDMPEEEVAAEQENLRTGRYLQITPLTKEGVELAPLGEAKVEGQDAVGIRVTAKDHKPVNLYFDKKTHMLVKMETTVKDPAADAEVTQTAVFGDYKKVDGVQVPHKVNITRDGKKFVESETTNISFPEGLDPELFKKPGS
jgi:outer membrane lipoprotein-sorting protein